MAEVPLAYSIIKTFKVRLSAEDEIQRWEAWVATRLFVDPRNFNWVNEIYRLRIFLECHRLATFPTFDPDQCFFKFMEEWKSQVLFLQSKAKRDYRDVACFRESIIGSEEPEKSEKKRPRSRPREKRGADENINEERRKNCTASSVLKFLGIEVREEDFAGLEDCTDDGDNTIGTSSEKRPVPSLLGDRQTQINPDSLTVRMLRDLNLQSGCEERLWSLDVNLQFRLRANKIDFNGAMTLIREFCRSNAGSGFYDTKGCLNSLVQDWYLSLWR